MQIRKVNRWRVNGLDFESDAKARDYLESLINSAMQSALTSTDLPAASRLTVSQCIRVTEAILANKERLAPILAALNDGTEDAL